MLYNDLAPVLHLDGPWEFALGEGSPWGQIWVPGCWEAQGFSKAIDGPARYRRQILVPEDWAGQQIWLEFDAVSYACTVFWNGHEAGRHRGMWSPFALDVTGAARPGQVNTLEVEVYKPGQCYPMRSCMAGFLPDVATTFGGIWQPVRLRALTTGLDHLHIAVEAEKGELRAQCQVVDKDGTRGISLEAEVRCQEQVVATLSLPVGPSGWVDAKMPLPEALMWSPEHPVLYRVCLRAVRGGQVVAVASRRLGIRSLTAQGQQLLLNGQPICLRGVLSWGWDPERIAPLFSAEQARAEIQQVRELGFNLIKLCLFVPNQVYFDVADEEGMLLWQEWPLWQPEVTDELRASAPGEYAAYMELTRHHPSVVLYSLGCELGRDVDEALLRDLDNTVRHAMQPAGTPAPGVLFCDNSGSGEAYEGLALDLSDFSDYHPYCDLNYLEPLLNHWHRDWKRPRPLILGEFCDSDDLRDFEAIVQAHGGRKPWWMTPELPLYPARPEAKALVEAQERLAGANLGFSWQEVIAVARAQSLTVRKFALETIRRRAEVQGYVITGLRDTPIASSGVLDDLGQPKWPAEVFRCFNSDTVLTLDVPRRRKWEHGGDRPDPLDPYNWWAGSQLCLHVIANHTGRPVPAGSALFWRVRDQRGQWVAEGQEAVPGCVAPGQPCELGEVVFTTPETSRAESLQLEVSWDGGYEQFSNVWNLWCYPRPAWWPAGLVVYDPVGCLEGITELLPTARLVEALAQAPEPRVAVVAVLDSEVQAWLWRGGKVLLLQQGDRPLPAQRGPFWREAIKLFPHHPLWELFPHNGFADLQFWGLATDTMLEADRLAEVLPGLQGVNPIMRRLDARQLYVREYILEAQVGHGWLLACTLRLQGGYGAAPTGSRNVAGCYLLWALLHHLDRTPQPAA